MKITAENIAKLEDIAFKGHASNGHRQDFQFALNKAIKEFIKKYDVWNYSEWVSREERAFQGNGIWTHRD